MWNHKCHFYLETVTGDTFSQKKKKKKSFYFAVIDMEKVFDQVPSDAFWRACRKLGIEEWLVKIVKLMYRNAQSINE